MLLPTPAIICAYVTYLASCSVEVTRERLRFEAYLASRNGTQESWLYE